MPVHSEASGEKEQIMLPLTDHNTRQGLTISTCTQIRVFKGNLHVRPKSHNFTA